MTADSQDRPTEPPAPREGGGARGAGIGRLTVDLAAIVLNWRSLVRRAAPAECAAVVKADAYGLGVRAIARALAEAGCRSFFVATLREAIELRAIVPRASAVLVLNGIAEAGLEQAAGLGITPVVNSLAQLDGWRGLAGRRGAELELCLQTDTGMSRFGLAADEIASLAASPERVAGLRPTLLMSHLGCADEPSHPNNRAQLERFRAQRARLRPVLGDVRASLAASSGIFLGPDYAFDMVRPGAALFGIRPNPTHEMLAVAGLEAPCAQVRRIEAGRPVGYGATFVAAREMRIATVAAGYADGFLRAGSNRGAVAWRGLLLPIVGLVSMDSITVDASDPGADGLAEGDMLELIGPSRPLDAVARDAGTIGYEVLTSLGRRYRRVLVGGGFG